MSIALNGDGIISGVSSITVGAGASVFSPAANTLALGTNGSERVRVTSSGNIGIGTVPKTWSTGYNVLQVGSASLVGQSEQDGQTSNWSNNAYFDTNDSRWEYSFADQASQITQSDGLIVFKTASTGTANAAISWTESARFNTSGNLAFPSGQGIDFSATANSSGTMTSELLSDYEEGTWTPANSVTTLTTGTNLYQKIGRLVYVQFDFSLATNASGTAISITGLPFTSNSGGSFYGVMMSDNFNILNAFPFVNASTSSMSFQISSTSGGARDTVAYSRIVSGGVVRGMLCYLT